MRVIIIGGGAFARELACWAQDAAAFGSIPAPAAYLDDAGDVMSPSYGLEYLGRVEDFQPDADDRLLMAIGDPVRKAAVAERLAGIRFETLIHPAASIARTVTVADGVIIGPHAYVAADARLGRLVGVNSLTGVGHDVQVGDFSTISSQVDLTGGVMLGDRVFVGSGARVLPNVHVGEGAKIGAGAVVVRKVRSGTTVFAAPARAL